MTHDTLHTDSAAAFVCRQCGTCCQGDGGIQLRATDISRLACHLALTQAVFLAEYARRRNNKWEIKSGASGACVFWRDSGSCGVHAARPDICRAWPFFRGNLVDAYSLALAKEYCPGIVKEIPFTSFARIGEGYLRRHGLACSACEPESPTALCVDAVAAFCVDATAAFCVDAVAAFCVDATAAFCVDATAAFCVDATAAFCVDAVAALPVDAVAALPVDAAAALCVDAVDAVNNTGASLSSAPSAPVGSLPHNTGTGGGS